LIVAFHDPNMWHVPPVAGRETVRGHVTPDELVLRREPPKPVKFATG